MQALVNCPSENLLSAFVSGQAADAELAAVHEHLDACAACRTVVAELLKPEQDEKPAQDLARKTAAPAPPALVELDEYHLLRPLGWGAMGSVYLAHDTVLDRQVAIKWIARIQPDKSIRSRFLIEARAIARLQHQNVASIYRVGQINGQPYLVYEYVRGESLDRLSKPVPWERVLQLASGLARGLEAAHRRGVLHRDIKPANAILAEDGEVKLLDFGLAKLLPLDGAIPPPTSRHFAPAETFATPPAHLHDSGPLGTPYYMAPEVWRGEPATPQADLYSLGALLYELCAGRPPYFSSSLEELRQAVRMQDARPLAGLVPAIDPRFAALVDRCLRRDPAQRFASVEELIHGLLLLPLSERALLPGGNPYRGLSCFEAEHRALFYGRNTEIRAVVELLMAEPLVVVTGDSGVGKSSLCRAGVLPLCQEGELAGGRTFAVATLLPGRKPLHALAAALAAPLAQSAQEVLERLRAPEALASALAERQAGQAGLLLFIDQMEELISSCDPPIAAAFTQALRALLDGARGVRVLATVRGDQLTRVAALPGLEELLRGLYLLQPLSAAGLREAIVNPVRTRGVSFESEALVEELVHDTVHAQGGLPLLSFALAELWEVRAVARRTIPATALQSIGGVAGALERHADAVLSRLTVQERTAARRLLGKLVTVEGLRVRRSETDLCPEGSPSARAALEALLRGRLLVARVINDASVYEIAHERLVTGWGTLNTWLTEGREVRALRQRMEQAASDWERLGRSQDGLWSKRQLAEAAPLLEALEPSPRERAFLGASGHRLRSARLRRGGISLGVLLLLSLLLFGSYYRDRREEDIKLGSQMTQARQRLKVATTARSAAEALQRQAFAAFDAQDKELGEEQWAKALSQAEIAEQGYAAASLALETALLVAPQRKEMRRMLGDVLAERAELAEQRHRSAQRDELLRYLRLYDPSGGHYRRLTAPARLRISSVPNGAVVTIAGYSSDEKGRRTLSPPRALGVTPLDEVEVAQGSYLLVLTASGRAVVRYPVLVGRGESLVLSIELPNAAAVPAGMLYIPTGRFLYGSAAPDELRRGFFHAQPLHQVTSFAYLIAQHETTFADWLEYLRALPPSERGRRLPHSGSSVQGRGLSVVELPDASYELIVETGTEQYRARAGESFHYPGRNRRSRQDWRRFPVTGISYEDAQAYVAWLRKTNKVPQARLCTEYEWERAARGADDREYPHGDLLSPDDANYDETYGKQAVTLGLDEVGSHPESRSPYGLDDMTGNAFEWVDSQLASGRCLVRGGSYYNGATTCRLTNRNEVESAFRNPNQGMRVCATYAKKAEPRDGVPQ